MEQFLNVINQKTKYLTTEVCMSFLTAQEMSKRYWQSVTYLLSRAIACALVGFALFFSVSRMLTTLPSLAGEPAFENMVFLFGAGSGLLIACMVVCGFLVNVKGVKSLVGALLVHSIVFIFFAVVYFLLYSTSYLYWIVFTVCSSVLFMILISFERDVMFRWFVYIPSMVLFANAFSKLFGLNVHNGTIAFFNNETFRLYYNNQWMLIGIVTAGAMVVWLVSYGVLRARQGAYVTFIKNQKAQKETFLKAAKERKRIPEFSVTVATPLDEGAAPTYCWYIPALDKLFYIPGLPAGYVRVEDSGNRINPEKDALNLAKQGSHRMYQVGVKCIETPKGGRLVYIQKPHLTLTFSDESDMGVKFDYDSDVKNNKRYHVVTDAERNLVTMLEDPSDPNADVGIQLTTKPNQYLFSVALTRLW